MRKEAAKVTGGPRYCVDCIHHRSPAQHQHFCMAAISLVTGIPLMPHCQDWRAHGTECGPEGNQYEAVKRDTSVKYSL